MKFSRTQFSVLAILLFCGLQPAFSQPDGEIGPRKTAETFFRSLKTADLKGITSVLTEKQQTATQDALDMIASSLGDQKLVVSMIFSGDKQRRALVISEPFRLTLTGENPPPLGSYVLDLEKTSGRWLIHDLNFANEEDAAKSIVEFRKLYSDIRNDSAPATDAASPAKPKRELTVFYMKYADATDVAGILNELFDEFSIVVDVRTGTLFVRYDEGAKIEAVEEVLRILDAEKEKPKRVSSGQAKQQQIVEEVPPTQIASGVPAEVNTTITGGLAELRTRFAEFNRRAAMTAQRCRSLQKADGDTKQVGKMQTQLRQQVEETFQARQELQRAELAQLQKRFSQIQHQIESREKIRSRIIDRRVEELLDPALQWDSLQNPSSPVTARAESGRTNPLLETAGGAPGGLAQTQSPQALVQARGIGTVAAPNVLGGKPVDVQAGFSGLEGASIDWVSGPITKALVMPATVNLPSGRHFELALSQIPGHEGRELSGSLELRRPEPATAAFLNHNRIPVTFSNFKRGHRPGNRGKPCDESCLPA